MVDFRHPDNPVPFTRLLLEQDTAPLTQQERSAVRCMLAKVSREMSDFYGRAGSLDRGAVASDLRRFSEQIEQVIRQLRNAMLAERPGEE